jgi:hypothetical protein
MAQLRHCAISRVVLGFDPRWCHWNFFTGFDSASNRIEYQEYFMEAKGGRWLGLINLPPSWADSLEIWEPQTPRNLRTTNSPVQESLFFYLYLLFRTKLEYEEYQTAALVRKVNTVMCQLYRVIKSLFAPDGYSTNNPQKYFKQFQSLTMIT